MPGRFTQPTWRRIRLLAGVLLLLSATTAGAAPLSLQGAEAIALRQNPGLGALTQKIAELRHKAVAVAQLPDPHLGLGAVNLPINSFSMNRQQMSMLSVGLSQTFPSFGKLGLEGQQAGIEAQA
ncbi:MAG: transporter, partial [Acidithiobacillus ferrivorans]